MEYRYIDGMGNCYRVIGSHIKYGPMTKELSSSGLYDGGSPWQRELSKIDLMRIVDVLERAIWNAQDQTDERAKGCSSITKLLGSERQTIHLRRGSDTAQEVHDLMTSFEPE